MPVPYLNKVHEKTKISMKTLEHMWDAAKKAAGVEKGDEKGWGLVTHIFQTMLKAKKDK